MTAARQVNVEVEDLSAMYEPHRYYNYFRSRELEKTFPGGLRTGAWITTYNRTLFGWGQLTEKNDSETAGFVAENETFPAKFDILAKTRRIHHYLRIRNSTDCRSLLRKSPNIQKLLARGISWRASGAPEIKAAFEYTNQFLMARQGIIKPPLLSSPIIGTHSVPLLAVNEPQRSILFGNIHWGMEWGYKSRGEMPFEYFDIAMVEAWLIDETKPTLPSGPSIVDWRWEANDLLWKVIYGLEIYDPSTDDRIAWSFAVIRDGLLEVDEFYVRPAYRRSGFGSQLAGMLHDLAVEKNVPIKLWIPYPDAEQSNRPALAAIVGKLGLGIRRSGVRWAAYAATAEEPRSIAFPFVRIPEKPAAAADHGEELHAIPTLEGSVLRFNDPFGPAADADDWEACS